jgi:hypothetical protein
VIGDRGRADEQLPGDLPVGSPAAGQPGDQRFLRGKGRTRLERPLAGALAGRAELATGPLRKPPLACCAAASAWS